VCFGVDGGAWCVGGRLRSDTVTIYFASLFSTLFYGKFVVLNFAKMPCLLFSSNRYSYYSVRAVFSYDYH
jgi:hypothetical protein